MASGDAERVKERTDIVQLIGDQIPLKRAGQNFKALCPFHQEKTPSFIVSPSRQSFHCFGCGKSGDCYTWLMEREGMTFPEALRVLAQRVGVSITFDQPEQREERERLRATLDTAATFYHAILTQTSEGRVAKEYLIQRGITEKSIETWRIGFVPVSGTPLTRKAAEAGVSEQDLINAGILGSGRRGVYERFYGRILFPLADTHGSIIGFAGRILEESSDRPTAKYINSPETVLYRKSTVLYGLNDARDAIREHGFVVVVEGYTDVIASHQAGIRNVVATSGTALTEDHVRIMKRYTDHVVFAFDADTAGSTATRRAMDIAFGSGMEISVIPLPAGSDPADIATRDVKSWRDLIERKNDMFSFLLDRACSMHKTDTPHGRKAITADILPLIARIPDAVVRGTFIQILADHLRIEQRYLSEDLERIRRSEHLSDSPRFTEESLPEIPQNEDTRLKRERRLLALLLTTPRLLSTLAPYLRPELLYGEQHRNLYSAFQQWYNRAYSSQEVYTVGELDLTAFEKTLSPELRRCAEELRLAHEVEEAEDVLEMPERDAIFLVKQLLCTHIRDHLQDTTRKMKYASDEERKSLLEHTKQLHKELAQAEQLALS